MPTASRTAPTRAARCAGRPSVLERARGIGVEQLAGSDQMRGDRLGVRLGQAAQLGPHRRIELLGVDAVRDRRLGNPGRVDCRRESFAVARASRAVASADTALAVAGPADPRTAADAFARRRCRRTSPPRRGRRCRRDDPVADASAGRSVDAGHCADSRGPRRVRRAATARRRSRARTDALGAAPASDRTLDCIAARRCAAASGRTASTGRDQRGRAGRRSVRARSTVTTGGATGRSAARLGRPRSRPSGRRPDRPEPAARPTSRASRRLDARTRARRPRGRRRAERQCRTLAAGPRRSGAPGPAPPRRSTAGAPGALTAPGRRPAALEDPIDRCAVTRCRHA